MTWNVVQGVLTIAIIALGLVNVLFMGGGVFTTIIGVGVLLAGMWMTPGSVLSQRPGEDDWGSGA